MELEEIKRRCKTMINHYKLFSRFAKITEHDDHAIFVLPGSKTPISMTWIALYNNFIIQLKRSLNSSEAADIWFDLHVIE